MKAEVISVGTELLLGNIVNTNAAYIGSKLAELGIDEYYQTVVGDNRERLNETLSEALSRSDIVLITGGLGPTYDDVTKEVVANKFGRKLIVFEPALQKIRGLKKIVPNLDMDLVERMAYVPENSYVLPNDKGSAAGFAITEKEKTVVAMPGPPNESEYMMDTYVVPYLSKLSGKTLYSSFVNMIGISESEVEKRFEKEMTEYTNPTIAPYIKPGEVMARITASADTKENAEALIEPVKKLFAERCGEYIYGFDKPNIETAALDVLKTAGKTIAIAESCTGGLVAKRITDIAGASEVFLCGMCSYSNSAKMNVLGVKKETLDKFGAVSEQTAAEMAEGVKRISGADIGVSTTGIAGPGGGTAEKPVGLVYIGISGENGTRTIKLMLRGDRKYIREVAASNVFWNVIHDEKKEL